MKLQLSAALIAILLAGTVTAQHSAQKVNFGIKGGLNLSSINNESGAETDLKPGLNIGALAHIHLARQLALQPEIVYSQQGAKYIAGGTEVKRNLNYINVPVLFQYMFDNGFRLQAGPQVGFLVAAKDKVGDETDDIKDITKPVDFALSAGLGYVHPASGFGVDARYNLGLSNINEIGTTTSTNRGIQLGVFYLINHKR